MAQLNDLIVNGNTRFLNSAYGNLVGSAASALTAGAASLANNANKLGTTAASSFALKDGNYSANGLIAKSALKAGEAISATYAFSSYYNFGSNLDYNSAYNFTGNADSAYSAIPWTALNSDTNASAYLRNVVLGKNNIAYKRQNNFNYNINVTEHFETDHASNPFILMGNWNTAAGGGTCIGVKGSAWNGGVTLGVARRESPALAYNCALAIKGSAWDGSFSLGKSTANSESFSLGSGNSASLNSLAFGTNNKANNESLAFGSGNSASEKSLTFGTDNSATNYSMANGINSKANTYGFSLGFQTSAYTNSIAVGSYALATNNSIAVGESVTAAAGGAAFGKYNANTNGLLVIGNGTSTQRSDILVVDSTQVSASKLNTPVLKNERFEHNLYTAATYNAGAASALKNMWANLPQNSYKFAYTNNGKEYTYLLSKSPSATSGRYWGTILAWTYDDKWPKILRYKENAWQSSDWEKICVPTVSNNVLIFG